MKKTIKNQKAGVLNDNPLISLRNHHYHCNKNFLVISMVTLFLGILLNSSMISIKATYLQNISDTNDHIESLSAQKCFFIGSVHDLERNGREPTFFALFLIFSHALFTSPINFTVFYNNEQISLDNALYYSKDFTLNRTFIIGFCDGYAGTAI